MFFAFPQCKLPVSRNQYNLVEGKEVLKGQFFPLKISARKVFSALLHNVTIEKICCNSISKSL